MLSAETIDTVCYQLKDIRDDLIKMDPDPGQAKRLDRIYDAILKAEYELQKLAGRGDE